MFKLTKQFKTRIFLLVGLIVLASFICLLPQVSLAKNDPAEPLTFTSEITIPGFIKAGEAVKVGSFNKTSGDMESNLLALMIIGIFNYAVSASAIIISLILMGAGVLWLTSRGSSSQIETAKKLISGSFIGLAILLFSWVILNTINPKLTELDAIKTKVILPDVACCHPESGSTIGVKGECASPSVMCEDNYFCTKTTNGYACSSHLGSTCCVYEYRGASGYNTYYSYSTVNSDAGEKCPSTKEVFNSGDITLAQNELNKNLIFSLIETKKDNNCGDLELTSSEVIPKVCDNADPGERCNPYGLGNAAYGGNNGFCYNNLCYLGTSGKEDEPCGTEYNSKCLQNKYLKDNSLKCISDKGGRGCNMGLVCCQHDAENNLKK